MRIGSRAYAELVQLLKAVDNLAPYKNVDEFDEAVDELEGENYHTEAADMDARIRPVWEHAMKIRMELGL